MKYYIIAGEASGDLHGSNLIKELKKLDNSSHFRCWGGDLISQECDDLVRHYKDYSHMGFFEVFINLKKILSNLSFCKKDIKKYNPDVIIYVDFPGFNLRIAKWAKNNKFKNHFYISPQIWAWKQNRIKTIRKVIDQMYVILPFEKKFYSSINFNVHYVGHPLLDVIKTNKNEALDLGQEKIIALLPGSRDQEIKKILPEMINIIKNFKNYSFYICAAPSQKKSTYLKYIKDNNIEKVKIVENQTYEILSKSSAALVTSGTATLETALFKIPQVVCYKSSWISIMIGRFLLRNLKYISLVNLILDKEVVKELIQENLNEKNLTSELKNILEGENRNNMLKSYNELINKLGNKGASEKTALKIFNYLEPNSYSKES
ncbi:MAG: lipid-A-disaccharide synthase [Flavobacteriaceae bacterium]|nr:lipid-A-disaccharide synthase [Flavobacteriaceae bacterium]